jgi:23S rRNA pseudouridine1911/1915/1917 synthase
MKTTQTDPALDIIFEDNHLLAIRKRPGILSQEDHTGRPDVLTICKNYLKTAYNKPGNVFLGLLHRLDQPVGGVMILAKTSKAASRISEQIRKRTFKKRYLAVVRGETDDHGFLQHHLLKDPKTNRVTIVKPGTRGAREATLIFKKRETQHGVTLLDISLITGRAHQIRVQLAEQGTPILGDHKYGGGRNTDIALYASEVLFEHPTLKKEVHLKSKPFKVAPWSDFSLV